MACSTYNKEWVVVWCISVVELFQVLTTFVFLDGVTVLLYTTTTYPLSNCGGECSGFQLCETCEGPPECLSPEHQVTVSLSAVLRVGSDNLFSWFLQLRGLPLSGLFLYSVFRRDLTNRSQDDLRRFRFVAYRPSQKGSRYPGSEISMWCYTVYNIYTII